MVKVTDDEIDVHTALAAMDEAQAERMSEVERHIAAAITERRQLEKEVGELCGAVETNGGAA